LSFKNGGEEEVSQEIEEGGLLV